MLHGNVTQLLILLEDTMSNQQISEAQINIRCAELGI